MSSTVTNYPILNCQVFPVFAETDESPTSQKMVPAQEGLWESIDEQELAREIEASFPGNTISSNSVLDLDPDDFERLYQWFLS